MTTEQNSTSKQDKKITEGSFSRVTRGEDDRDKQEVEIAVKRMGILTCVHILKPRTGARQEIRGRWERTFNLL